MSDTDLGPGTRRRPGATHDGLIGRPGRPDGAQAPSVGVKEPGVIEWSPEVLPATSSTSRTLEPRIVEDLSPRRDLRSDLQGAPRPPTLTPTESQAKPEIFNRSTVRHPARYWDRRPLDPLSRSIDFRYPSCVSTSSAGNLVLWAEWKRSTRFLESARLAFARERNLWATLEIDGSKAVELRAPAGQGSYKVSLEEHIQTVSDEEELFSAVLIQTYAIAEAAALDRLGLASAGGIEDWGHRLLLSNDRDWTDVLDGKAGLVEAAVVRNTFAHGTRRLRPGDAQRLTHAGASARAPGDAVSLTYDDVKLYRDRLRSLMRVSGFQ